ncbi:MAG TPA: CCA tRNA nucleotidyltransferase [Gemmatimonadales bacterium]|nr:CCA tRNA nucleotidyltransferase [Gemmatimonadales bacterium]
MTLALRRLEVPPEVVEIAQKLEDAGHEAWCVGGALRDAILEEAQLDFDLATSATPEQVQQLFRRTVPIGVRFGTVGVLDRARRMHEVTTFRRDVETDGRHAVVQYGVSLEDDLARRDFTINALAYHPLRGEWRDPFGGAADIALGVVRAVGEPAARFREDYLRILRALRFAARFGFRIEERTWAAARENAPGLEGLSAERVRDEWFKGLSSARSVSELVRFWRASRAAGIWLPELRDVVLEVPREERDAVLLTVLLTAAPVAVLRRLKASGAEIARAQAAVAAPAEPVGADEVAVRRWLSAAGGAADDAMMLHRWRTGTPAPWASTVATIRARGDALRREQLAVSGTDLLEAGVPAGPALGTVLGRLLDRVLVDPSLNTREQLLALAREQA